MARNWYRKKRTIREMAGATLAIIIVLLAMAVVGRLEEGPPPVEQVELTPKAKADIVARWYGEIYPAYAVVPPERRP